MSLFETRLWRIFSALVLVGVIIFIVWFFIVMMTS